MKPIEPGKILMLLSRHKRESDKMAATLIDLSKAVYPSYDPDCERFRLREDSKIAEEADMVAFRHKCVTKLAMTELGKHGVACGAFQADHDPEAAPTNETELEQHARAKGRDDAARLMLPKVKELEAARAKCGWAMWFNIGCGLVMLAISIWRLCA